MNKQLCLLLVVRYAFESINTFGYWKREKILVNLLFGDLQLNNLGLAVSLARRGNLPGAEDLVRIAVIFSILS